MEKITAWITLSDIFFQQNYYYIFFYYTFITFWFITIIYLRSIFTELFILFIFMFFGQVSRTTISFTWRIIRTTSFLISITSIVYLIFKWKECLFWTTSFKIRYTILFCPFTWVDWFSNTSFFCNLSVWSFLSFIFARNTLLIWSYTW